MLHWLQHFFGFDAGQGNGTHYLFWSGFGSDLGELTLVAGMVAIYKKHTCEVTRCWRLARHDTAAGHSVCRKHHPDDHLTADDVVKAHQAAQNPYPPQAERRMDAPGH